MRAASCLMPLPTRLPRAFAAGVGAYNAFLKEVPLRKMFFWTSVIGTGLGLTQLVLITGALTLSSQLLAMC